MTTYGVRAAEWKAVPAETQRLLCNLLPFVKLGDGQGYRYGPGDEEWHVWNDARHGIETFLAYQGAWWANRADWDPAYKVPQTGGENPADDWEKARADFLAWVEDPARTHPVKLDVDVDEASPVERPQQILDAQVAPSWVRAAGTPETLVDGKTLEGEAIRAKAVM